MSALDQQTVELVALDRSDGEAIVTALRACAEAGFTDGYEPEAFAALAVRLEQGAEYRDAKDELIQLDARKKLLAAEADRVEARMEELRAELDEEWRERGITSERTEDGILLHRTRGRVFAKVARPDGAESADPAVRQAACDALKAAELGDYVAEQFNAASLGAHFRELSDAYDEAQRLLPASERVPKDINDFLPDQLRGLIELTDNPTISIKRS